MDSLLKRLALASSLVLGLAVGSQSACGQGYGTDLQNVLAPASGGMAGVSVAMPQDVPSAIFGNPATLTQFHGTQFTFGGGWLEGYPTITNNGSLNTAAPGVPFSVTSRAQGFPAVEIGVTQDFECFNIPGTLGLGVAGLSGMAAEYRGRAPAGSFVNDITTELLILGINLDAGVQLTDNLSAGAAFTVSPAFEQLGFVGPLVSTAMVNSWGIRGTFGLDYAWNECTDLGFYYMTPLDFQFPNALRIGTTYHDIRIEQPTSFGWGIANHGFMNGRLLVAADVYYKLWEDADLYRDIYLNQWAFAIGSQLTNGRYKYRLGYSYNENPMNHDVGNNLDGIPIGQAAVQLFQAASAGVITQHRLTAGLGIDGFIFPNVDLDMFVGGMFNAHDTFGDTQEHLALWYAGVGFTWRFDDCCPSPRTACK
jgi:long-chain fatty acid transport protein